MEYAMAWISTRLYFWDMDVSNPFHCNIFQQNKSERPFANFINSYKMPVGQGFHLNVQNIM